MWGRWEAEGLPADLEAVVAAFNAAGMNITTHIIDRELYQRTVGPWRRVHNANYFSALQAAAEAAPHLPVLLLEDDVQLASFFSLRLCRLLRQLAQALNKTAEDAWAVDLMNPYNITGPSEYFPRAAPGLFEFGDKSKENFYGNQGMLYSPGMLPDLSSWFYNFALGTKGTPGEVDSPMDFVLRDFMEARQQLPFYIVQEALVQHIGLKSSLGGTFWAGRSFLDARYRRLSPRQAGSAEGSLAASLGAAVR
ncbi:hypothetical protein WJX81_001913 [Elliptochloris bilobata]|uniref:Nucleotide-diphospho-sugar transferase domain-containing protein n=1 Tax=Elliptochloris bilobata TaxID=381761 RepID=A0AAW1R199_9CHLO